MKAKLVQLVGILVAVTMFSLTQATNPATELGALMRIRAAIPKLQRPWNVTEEHCTWLGIKCRNGVVVIIRLSHLNLRGTIPSNTIAVLKDLRRLVLSTNKLSGPLPSDIGDARLLNILRLELNAFTGNLPPSLGNLKGLLDFNVSNNPLEGQIPSTLQHWSPTVYVKTKLCGKPLRVCPAPPPSPPPPPPPSPPSPHPPDNTNPPPSPTDRTRKLLEIILPSAGIPAVGLIGGLIWFLYNKYFKSSTIRTSNPSEVEKNQGLNNEASKNNETVNETTLRIALTNAETVRADSMANSLKDQADLDRMHLFATDALARDARSRAARAELVRMQEPKRDARSKEAQAESPRMQESESEAKKKVLEMTDMQPMISSARLHPPPKVPATVPPTLPHHPWATSFDEESVDHDITTIDDHTPPERESKLVCLA